MTSITFDQAHGLAPVVEKIKQSIQTSVLVTAITSACVGISLPEVVVPLTKLIEQIIVSSQWSDIESSIAGAIDCGGFQLGDEALSVIADAFKTRSLRQYTGNFGNMVMDAWNLHQIDDTGSIAGGEAVLEFVQKYKN